MADDLLRDGDLWRALQRLFRAGARRTRGRSDAGAAGSAGAAARSSASSSSTATTSARRSTTSRRSSRSPQDRARGHRAAGERRPRAGRSRASPAEQLQKMLEQMAAEHQAARPAARDPAGRIQELQNYDFMDPEARQHVPGADGVLQQQMMQPHLPGHAAGHAEHEPAGHAAHARDAPGPEPDAATRRPRAASPTSRASWTSGASFPRRREPRRADRADRPPDGQMQSLLRQHDARAAPAARRR